MFGIGKKKTSNASQQQINQLHPGRWLRYIVWFLATGVIGIVAYAVQFRGQRQFWSTLGVGLLIAFGVVLLGAVVGLLFGLPNERPDKSADKKADQNQKQNSDEPNRFQPSTRLLEIADWLTKILVGLGLVELGKIGPKLRGWAHFLAAGLGNVPSSDVAALAILLYYFAGGFLLGFLWTNLYLPNLLSASFFHLQDKVKQMETYISQLGPSRNLEEPLRGIALGELEEIKLPASDAPRLLYFAYGSNMLTARLQENDRAPSASFKTIAKLQDYAFDFSKHGGKGNIHKAQGQEVWGVLFAVTEAERDQLDRVEGGYDREDITVVDPGGNRHLAFAYIAPPSQNPTPPTGKYKDFIVRGAKEHGLRQEYIAMLETFPVRDAPQSAPGSEGQKKTDKLS